jgi:hypothetical protein
VAGDNLAQRRQQTRGVGGQRRLRRAAISAAN